MTDEQQTALAAISHPITACDLAYTLGWPLEVVYRVLVSLEAKGLARVRIDFRRHCQHWRGWVAA